MPVDRIFPFRVEGIPAPQGSKTAFRRGNRCVLVETSKKLPAWREACMAEFKNGAKAYGLEPIDAPVCVRVEFLMPRPKKPTNNYPYVGDLDKLQRGVGDALEQSGVVKNDSRIVEWRATKRYAEPGEEPGAIIEAFVVRLND